MKKTIILMLSLLAACSISPMQSSSQLGQSKGYGEPILAYKCMVVETQSNEESAYAIPSLCSFYADFVAFNILNPTNGQYVDGKVMPIKDIQSASSIVLKKTIEKPIFNVNISYPELQLKEGKTLYTFILGEDELKSALSLLISKNTSVASTQGIYPLGIDNPYAVYPSNGYIDYSNVFPLPSFRK